MRTTTLLIVSSHIDTQRSLTRRTLGDEGGYGSGLGLGVTLERRGVLCAQIRFELKKENAHRCCAHRATHRAFQVGQCYGLTNVKAATSADSCRAACCAAGPSVCTTWQWAPATGAGGYTNSCWIGNMQALKCDTTGNGWITGGRNSSAGPAPPPGPPPKWAGPEFDDASWRAVETPHDWAIEDLPAREDDTAVPVGAPGLWVPSRRFGKRENVSAHPILRFVLLLRITIVTPPSPSSPSSPPARAHACRHSLPHTTLFRSLSPSPALLPEIVLFGFIS